jgi:hypothetical protein
VQSRGENEDEVKVMFLLHCELTLLMFSAMDFSLKSKKGGVKKEATENREKNKPKHCTCAPTLEHPPEDT